MAIVDSAGNPSITFTALFGEFGGTAPHALSEYYRDGVYADGIDIPNGETRIPASGIIKFSDFYGTSGTPAASYTISPSTTTPNEGGTVIFTFGGTDLPDGSVYFGIVHGTTSDSDFTVAPPQDGTRTALTITSGVYAPTTASVVLSEDALTDSAETFTGTIYSAASGGTLLATSSTVTINDTSQTVTLDAGAGTSISVSDTSPFQSGVGIRFNTDGTVSKGTQIDAADLSWSAHGNWITGHNFAGADSAGNYSVRYTNRTVAEGGGTADFDTKAADSDVWISLVAAREYSKNDVAVGGIKNWTVDFQVRKTSGAPPATATVSQNFYIDNNI